MTRGKKRGSLYRRIWIPVLALLLLLGSNAALLIRAEAPAGSSLAAIAVSDMVVEEDTLRFYVAVQVEEGVSGLDHINVQFVNDANDRSVTKILRGKDYSQGIYAGWIEFDLFEPQGVYVLDQVILQDQDGTYTRYCRAQDLSQMGGSYQALPMTAAFGVASGIGIYDETPPVLEAIAVTPVLAAAESEITVVAAVSDDYSGVDSVTARFVRGDGEQVSVTLEQNGAFFTGTLSDTQTEEPGTWTLMKVKLTDRMDNSVTYYEGDGPLAVEVSFTIQ